MRKSTLLASLLGAPTVIVLAAVPSIFDLSGLPTALLWIGIVGLWLVAVMVNYAALYRPLVLASRKRQDILLNLVANELVRELKGYVSCDCDLRVNVMLPKRPWYRLWTKRLLMRYSLGEYSPDEEAIRYPPGYGACGKAFQKNSPIFYDRDSFHDQLIDMPEYAESSTQHIGSILSIPVYSPDDEDKDEPVGVLNVDSSRSIEHSNFHDRNVQDVVIATSPFISVILT